MPELMTLSYRSKSLMQTPEQDLLPLVLSARAKNLALGITGLLMFDGRSFMQTLEGPEEATTEVFLRITEDTRHTRVKPFAISRIRWRRFPKWQMLYLDSKSTSMIASNLDALEPSERQLCEIRAKVLAGHLGQ